jgi:hypothetical protein
MATFVVYRRQARCFDGAADGMAPLVNDPNFSYRQSRRVQRAGLMLANILSYKGVSNFLTVFSLTVKMPDFMDSSRL